jgi:acyl-CoA synthetase (NDP forming)
VERRRWVNRSLKVFLEPASVAVIGATERPGSWGSFIMEGLRAYDYPGRIYPVNRKSATVYGLPAYPDVASIPEPVELAVLTIPEASIEEVVEACGAKGVRGMAMVTAGFGEAVDGGRDRELALAQLARSHGMRIMGPNVSGTFNLHAGFNAAASPTAHLVPSALAAVSQGGFALYDLMALGGARQMGVGKFIHTGNECDLQVTDFLEYFGEDPEVQGILMYLETVRDGKRFIETAKRVAEQKPIVVHKVGRTAGGARAARSHTGALAGWDEIYRGVFEQANVVLSPSMELLLPLGHALTEQPRMRGNRVAIMTMGGSWGVALADRLEEEGLAVPELGPALQQRLRALGMPPRASTRNPVDIGAAGPASFGVETIVEMAREVLTSGEVDAFVLHGMGRPGMLQDGTAEARKFFLEFEKQVMRACYELQMQTARPVVIASSFSRWESQAVHDLCEEGVRIFHGLDEIARVLARVSRYWGKLPASP